MELSVLIAKTFGLVYVVFGLGLLFNSAYYKKSIDEMLKSPAFMFFGGVMALVLGFLIVNAHNVWVKDWTVLVTIIGWMALVKGVVIFVAPKFLLDFSRPFLKNIPVIGVGAVILGGVFCYFGFFA